MSPTEQNQTNETNQRKNPKAYTGDKAPMVNMTMLKTSKAVTGAIERIVIRRSWIQSRKGELFEAFKSTDPAKKKDAYLEAERLVASLPTLSEKEEKLQEKLPEIQKAERAQLENLQFPDFGI